MSCQGKPAPPVLVLALVFLWMGGILLYGLLRACFEIVRAAGRCLLEVLQDA